MATKLSKKICAIYNVCEFRHIRKKENCSILLNFIDLKSNVSPDSLGFSKE